MEVHKPFSQVPLACVLFEDAERNRKLCCVVISMALFKFSPPIFSPSHFLCTWQSTCVM